MVKKVFVFFGVIIGALLFLAMQLLVSGCVAIAPEEPSNNPDGYDYPSATVPLISSPTAIMTWIGDNITYAEDMDKFGREYVQSPRRTLVNGFGDDEDQAILFLYIHSVNSRSNDDGDLVKFWTPDGIIYAANLGDYIYDFSGILYDYYPDYCDVRETWTCEEAMNAAINRHSL
jgi:hypothetical protein